MDEPHVHGQALSHCLMMKMYYGVKTPSVSRALTIRSGCTGSMSRTSLFRPKLLGSLLHYLPSARCQTLCPSLTTYIRPLKKKNSHKRFRPVIFYARPSTRHQTITIFLYWRQVRALDTLPGIRGFVDSYVWSDYHGAFQARALHYASEIAPSANDAPFSLLTAQAGIGEKSPTHR